MAIRNFATKNSLPNNKRTGVDKKVTLGRQRGEGFFIWLLQFSGRLFCLRFKRRKKGNILKSRSWQILKRHLHSVSGDIKDACLCAFKDNCGTKRETGKAGQTRRGRDNKQKLAVAQYWQYWHQQYWTISCLQPSASKVSICWSDCSCCFDTIYLSCLIYHISIENLQHPFSQFQGAVVPNNQLKIFLLARISSTRRPLATREITPLPWWQCALTLIIRCGGSLSGSQSKEVLWIFKICKYLTQYTYSTLIWRRFCCKENMFDMKISFVL